MTLFDRILHIPSRINKSMMNGALFATFSFINRGFGFFLLLILANYITPEEYGYLSLFTTVTMLLGYIIAFSSEGFFTLEYLRDGINKSKTVLTNIIFTSIATGTFFIILLFFFGEHLSKALALPINTLYLAIVTVFFQIYVNTNLEYYRIQEKVVSYGVLSCSNALLNFFVSILLVKTLGLGWEGRAYAITGCALVYGVFAFCFFAKKKFFTRFDISVWKEMLVWGVPLVPHLASNFLKQGCDRYIINYYHTIEDVGVFSFALTLTTLITMIGFGFNQSNSVSIYKICGDIALKPEEKRLILARQRKIYIGIYAMSSAVVVALCELLIPFVLPNYTASLLYLPILGVYGMLVCFYLVYTNYLFYYKMTKELMYITLTTAVIHLVLSLLFTRYSLYITSVIYCISQFVYVVLVRKQTLYALDKAIN